MPSKESRPNVAEKRCSNPGWSRHKRRTPSSRETPYVRRHAARVEVLSDQAAAALGGADDADRVGEQLVVVVRALDE
jgi:hypothetical protein